MFDFFALAVAFFSSILTIKVLLPLAPHIGLIDIPSERKRHDGAIPLIGGISIFTGVLIASTLFIGQSQIVNLYLISSALIVFIGTLDDIYDLSVGSRILFQGIIACVLVFGAGEYIHNFGNIISFGNVDIGSYGMIFTILAVIAAINAFNMVDGIDGLAGSMSIITIASVAILTVLNSPDQNVLLPLLIVVSTIPYLFYNVSTRNPRGKKIFMGDAGSMYMGLTIIWLLTISTQSSEASSSSFRPVTALWIIAIPLMDMFAIMYRRIRKGESPFKADNGHIHHIFLANGFTSRKALWLISFLSVLCAAVGITGDYYAIPEWLMLVGFILVFCVYTTVLQKHCIIPIKQRKVRARNNLPTKD
ncbi:UDP-N-acetylglucosamine--undecaprenyl-phosphate N-acetylglucosaminephosphotransferase [Thalassotalea sp. M1531]|uniref:Undecaprenyl-phosphate alpha-N-acetylglucosaminyl 1-phosphate transferase n=1 Tax=Thalassotalea algicola TaxID=2716224 RepID=A0A7Y0LFY0_9GAMM|nr:UDP-N-acetylglucosamine--undecaprenyl-phosphate N-acetylglucosaminephosphotransferase [Thalassotalea algicola]NMP32941.1 UDP-N-acetylglucosamine--undecaprenyl-phosphate N-acetylglucosaminephosphotransferase [Thalassotalea algicola]